MDKVGDAGVGFLRGLTRDEAVSMLERVFGQKRRGRKGRGRLADACLGLFDEAVRKQNEWVGLDVLTTKFFGTDDVTKRDSMRKRLERAQEALGRFFTPTRRRALGCAINIEVSHGRGVELSYSDVRCYALKIERAQEAKEIDPPDERLVVKSRSLASKRPVGFGSRFYIPHASLRMHFVGRERDIRAVEREFRESSCLAVCIMGIAGVGKSQLAAEYAHRKRRDYPGGCFWIAAGLRRPRASTIASALSVLQIPIGFVPDGKWPLGTQVEAVVDGLSADQRRTLLIFDDVDDWTTIRDLVHRLSRHHILITSRDPNLVPGVDIHSLRLSVLERGPALSLLLSCCSISRRPYPGEQSAERAAAMTIAEILGRLPLAIELAASYLNRWPGISFEAYLKLVAAGPIEAVEAAEIRFSHNQHDPVRTTFWAIWKTLKSADVRRLLACASVGFGPGPIPVKELARAADLSLRSKEGRPARFERVLEEAFRTGLMAEGQPGMITCNVLIRDLIRDALKPSELSSAGKAFLRATGVVTKWPLRGLVIPDGRWLLDHLETSEDRADWFEA